MAEFLWEFVNSCKNFERGKRSKLTHFIWSIFSNWVIEVFIFTRYSLPIIKVLGPNMQIPLYKCFLLWASTSTHIHIYNAIFFSILFPFYSHPPVSHRPSSKMPRGRWSRVVRFQVGYHIRPVGPSCKLENGYWLLYLVGCILWGRQSGHRTTDLWTTREKTNLVGYHLVFSFQTKKINKYKSCKSYKLIGYTELSRFSTWNSNCLHWKQQVIGSYTRNHW